MAKISRRSGRKADAADAAKPGAPDAVVVGAGVFGAWTAWHLQRLGRRVILIDAWGPGHSRASSGGESRLIRASYGGDEIYTRMAVDSLGEWKALSDRADLPLFHETGVLFFFQSREPYVEQTIEVHRRLELPTEILDRAAMARRFPQIDFEGIEIGLFEPEFGALMARRAVQALVADFIAAGGAYLKGEVEAPEPGAGPLRAVRLRGGGRIEAPCFVFACGAWLPKTFPALLGSRIFPTRQEVFFFAPPPGDAGFEAGRLPAWADFNQGDMYYGLPDLEHRGFKIAHDLHGPPIDPDSGDRTPSAAALDEARAFMERRFPAMRGRPLNEARVCQYENSASGDFLIDRHPDRPNVLLVGAGSGHGFKHGPAVGRLAAALATDAGAPPEPRFSLATKSERQARSVH